MKHAVGIGIGDSIIFWGNHKLLRNRGYIQNHVLHPIYGKIKPHQLSNHTVPQDNLFNTFLIAPSLGFSSGLSCTSSPLYISAWAFSACSSWRRLLWWRPGMCGRWFSVMTLVSSTSLGAASSCGSVVFRSLILMLVE